MPPQSIELMCSRCVKKFKHKSSLFRHMNRCVQNLKAPSRQKSCRQCVATKSRCDLFRPRCGRCQSHEKQCEYERVRGAEVPRRVSSVETSSKEHRQLRDDDEKAIHSSCDASTTSVAMPLHEGSQTAISSIPGLFPGRSGSFDESGLPTPPRGWHDTPDDIMPELVMSKQRSQLILETAHGTISTDAVARHAMFHVIRVLRSWPRILARYSRSSSQLPPMIHHLQVKGGLPLHLFSCCTLTKMWSGNQTGNREGKYDLILEEVRKLLREYHSYSEIDLLAATQSLLILMVILLFGSVQDPGVSHPIDAQLIVEVWNIKHRLACTGLFLSDETKHTVPSWKSWAIVSAKRRTILALHHLEWAWSLLHGYPILACFELGPLPAPAAGYLWRQRCEKEWERQYHDWLLQWKAGAYKLGELFCIKPGGEMDTRSEAWLAEVDEFGMMIMSEVNAINDIE